MGLNYTSDLSWLPTLLTPSKIVDVASTGTINNVDTSTTDSVIAVLRFTGAAPTVTGLKAGRRLIYLMAVGGPLVLSNESGSSIAANRIVTGTGGDATIPHGAVALLVYDQTAGRWRMGGVGADVSTTTTNGSAPQAAAEVDTTDATPTAIGDAVTLASDTITTIDVAVQCIQAGAAKAKVFSVRRSFLNDGGTVTDGTQQDLITAEELGGALAASVDLTRAGTTVQPKVTGVAATALRWYLISQSQTVTAAAAGAVPSAPTAISPSSGSTAGGTSVTITVTESTGLTGAKVGGVALTGFAIVDGTHVSGTTGAHAAGAVDVVVSNANGDSAPLAASFTYSAPSFDPATLALSGWWRTDYAASPWTSTASAGASGGRTASEATNPPSVGAAINGHNPADFDGTNDKLTTTVLESDLFTAAAGSLAILYYADTTDAASGAYTDEEAMFAGAGGYIVASANNTGARVVLYDTGAKSIQLSVGGAGAWHLLQAKWDGTNLKARVDSGAWTSLACGNMGDLTSALNIGCNHNATTFFDGRIAEVITAASTLSDANFDNLITYVNSRYGLTL